MTLGELDNAKLVLGLVMLAALLPLHLTLAAPAPQFAGCADEIGEQFGARYIVHDLRGIDLLVAVIGIGDFDPEVTVLNAAGEPMGCNTDSAEAQDYAVGLPQVKAPSNGRTAVARIPIPDTAPMQDYEIIVTSANNTSGEFVLIIDGVEIFGADNVDHFTIFSNEGQVEEEAPLGIYVANLNRPEQIVDPVIYFSYSTIFERTCYKSSSAALCEGDHQDLTGSTATVAGEEGIMNGDDVMVFVELGGSPANFDVEISSYQQRSFGPYTLLIYSGVGYPPDLPQ